MTGTIEGSGAEWPLRPWLLAVLGAASGLAMHFVLGENDVAQHASALRIAVAAFLGSLALLIGFTLERERWQWALVFSGICALVIALVFYWNGGPDDWRSAENWRAVCGLLAVAIAAPLFQAARDAGARRFPYGAVHDHAWTNVVMWFAAWAFVGIVFLLAFLLAELFSLIKITLLRDALQEQWFFMTLAGAALGAAVGVFRERERIVRLLFTVAVAVLSVLAPVLGAGLLLFLASLPFTGLAPLWDATKSTTPILLSCVIGALILANAVIGRSDAEEKTFLPLRWGALALAVAMLPLAIIAAVSTGTRIAQYGYTPDRLWAVVFVIVALAYGIAYLALVLRHRLAWAGAARRINLGLSFSLCVLALFLALPLLSFNAIATRDQVARLESGRVTPEKFDWAALRFDFGDPGKAAVARLARSGTAAIRTAAAQSLKSDDRYDMEAKQRTTREADALGARLRVFPPGTPLPEELRRTLTGWDYCGGNDACVVFYDAATTETVVVRRTCDPANVPEDRATVAGALARNGENCEPKVSALHRIGAEWTGDPALADRATRTARAIQVSDALARGALEIRPVTRRQIFIDGRPAGAVFE